MRQLGRFGLVLIVAASAGCNRAADSHADKVLPPSPPVVEVTLHDYRFEVSDDIPAGRVVFRIRNAGRAHHRPALLPLEEGLPPLDEQLRGSERAAVAPFAGTRTRAPDDTGAFAVDLAPGTRYGFVCFVRDDVVGPHALKGMSHEFRTSTP